MTDPMTQQISIWTVYRYPKDYPDKFVARMHIANKQGSQPTENIIISQDLEIVQRILLDMGLTRLERNEEDDPVIIESWL
jgi:hypothetical protein